MGDHPRNSILSWFEDIEAFERCLNLADSSSCGRKEMEFVDDMKEKYEEYDSRMYLSEKQADWLKKIAGWEED